MMSAAPVETSLVHGRSLMTLPNEPNTFIVELGRYGLFTGEPSSDGISGSQLATVHIERLGKPLLFFAVTVTSIVDDNRTDHVVVSAYPPFPAEAVADAVQRLLPACAPAALCVIVADRTGWSRASSFAAVAPEAIAASVAYTKASGGWDESDPIVVEVEDRTFNVSPEFKEGAWRLLVRDAPNLPQ